MSSRSVLVAVAVASVVALSACSTQSSAAATAKPAVAPASARGTLDPARVPAPAAKDVVLVVKGGAVTNAPGELRLSIVELEELPTVEVNVYEPFVKRRITFRGVRLEDLLAFVRLPASVRSLHAAALNDYAVEIPLTVTAHPGAVLATRADGRLIGIKDGGPTRIVFTDDHPKTGDQSLWIWSLASLSPR